MTENTQPQVEVKVENLVEFTFFYPGYAKTYLIENSLAQRVKSFLDDRDIENETRPAQECFAPHYINWTGEIAKDAWLRAVNEKLGLRVVPKTIKDSSQPDDADFMMALYRISKEDEENKKKKSVKPKL